METRVLLILSLLVLSEADFGLSSSTIPQRSLREIVNKRRQLNYLKGLLQDLDDKLERMEKRSCLINIPGTDCDYRDITGIGKDHGIWMDKMAPGKKRRFERALQYLL